MSVEVIIRHEDRRTLAMRITPEGVVVLLPQSVDPGSAQVQDFIAAGLAQLPAPEPLAEPMGREALEALVDQWARRLKVVIREIRVREMRRKWASFSSNGVLTVARDLLTLPRELVEYAICHELLHQRLPDHGKGFQAMLTAWMPDWRERERRLMVQGISQKER